MCCGKKNVRATAVSNLKQSIVVMPETITYSQLTSRYFNDMTNSTFISAKKIAEGDMLTKLLHLWCLDQDSLIKAFADKGVTITKRDDLENIAKLSNSGQDRMGAKADNGKMVTFDTVNIVNNIVISTDKLNSATCDIRYV